MKLQVILGSTRPGRSSERVATWVVNEAKNNFDEVELIDLKEYKLPFFDELISPQYNPAREPSEEVKKWLDKVAEADAYVLVTPEYNRSTSAVLKNALDHLDYQFANKPVAIVAHGVNGGAQAVSHLRDVVPQVLAISVPKATYVTMAGNIIDESGVLDSDTAANPYGPLGALKSTLEQTKQLAEVLAPLRG